MSRLTHGVEPTSGARVLFVSRSSPPGESGSAHVMKALIEADTQNCLLPVGGRRPLVHMAADRVQRFPTELSVMGRGARFLAPARELLKPVIAGRLARLAQRGDVRRIVCVFPDAFYAEAALRAARSSGKAIRFWFHNTYADNRRGVLGWRARRLEAAMLSGAERLYFISDALLERFLERHPGIKDKAEVLRHPVPQRPTAARGFRTTPVRASLIGNLNESNLDAAARLVRALSPLSAVRVSICTPVPRQLLAWRGMDLSRVDFLGYLPENALAQHLDQTDLFLLPHGLAGAYSVEEYRTIFPTRAAHYLTYGRPILAHCPAESGLRRFLERHGCAVCVSAPQESALVSAFEALLNDEQAQRRLAHRAAEVAALFDPAGVLATLLDD